MLDLQDQVQLFPETEAALREQQEMGVKVLIYSDVERRYLDMYVSKFKAFRPDFVGTTDEAGFHKPHAKTYFWVDPVEEIVGVLMTQHMVGFDLPEADFRAVVYGSIED